jgi:Phage tail tube protein
MPTPIPTRLRLAGIAKGASAAATNYLRFKTYDWEPMIDQVPVDVLTGDMGEDVDLVSGFAWASLSGGGPLFADEFGWPIAGILGDITTTGSSAPFTHAISLLNTSPGQPTAQTKTFYDGMAAGAQQFGGMQWEEVTLKWSADQMAEISVKALSFMPTVVAKPTNSYTTTIALPSWTNTVSIAGSAYALSTSGEITWKRKSEIIKAINGTQTPLAIFLGSLGVSGKFTAVMEDYTEITRYEAGTKVALDFSFASGTGASAVVVNPHFSQAKWKKAKPNYGKEYVAVDVDFVALKNVTDAGASGGLSPCKVTLQNAVAAGTYI